MIFRERPFALPRTDMLRHQPTRCRGIESIDIWDERSSHNRAFADDWTTP
jgi:hypothetical protein